SEQTFPTHAAILGNGETLLPGTYLIAEASSIEGNLVMDAGGNANAIFIIKIEGAFSPGPSSQVILTGGALACNIYWAVEGGAIAMAASSKMKGNFIANPGAVSMAASSSLEGRLLSTTGAISVDGVTAAIPVCSALLPLILTDFTLQKQGNAVVLLWTGKDEHSFAGYELQRSQDGFIFNSIGFVVSSGDTGPVNYQWTDQQPLPAMSFYRLKMIDRDGKFTLSHVLFVSQNPLTGFSIFPNPVSAGQVQLQMASVPKGNYQMRIYNEAGIRMKELDIKIGNETVNIITVPLRLSAGFYFLVIHDPGGSRQAMKFIMK
ncbi:MAG TPA: ice-binding family protein, partial [Chitinophagaceae bacterium]|nr:ice-binding family protein [Chitinophagaceae bacterium]